MVKTIAGVFAFCLAFAGMVFAENPAKERETPSKAVENANSEQAVDENLREFTWLGKLVDQDCKDKHIDRACPVSPASERFGLVIDGGIILPFNEAGNEKTKELVAKGGLKGNIEVSVVGARQGGVFNVQSIEPSK